MKVRNIISVVLAIAAVALAVVLYNCIMHPVKFDNEYNKRSEEVIAKLKDIRVIQETWALLRDPEKKNRSALERRILRQF